MLKLPKSKFWEIDFGAEKKFLLFMETFGAEYAKSLDFHPNGMIFKAVLTTAKF